MLLLITCIVFMSSAKITVSSQNPCDEIVVLSSSLYPPIFLSSACSSSITMMNSRGARGQPCLMALWSCTPGVVRPGMFVFMRNCVPFRQFRTKSIRSSWAPILMRAFWMLDHLMESYAFDMS